MKLTKEEKRIRELIRLCRKGRTSENKLVSVYDVYDLDEGEVEDDILDEADKKVDELKDEIKKLKNKIKLLEDQLDIYKKIVE